VAKVDQLVTELERQIRTGQLLPGERLPPVRAFAEDRGLAPNTAAAVYKALGARGFVEGQGRRGTFVTSKPPVRVSPYVVVPEHLVNLTQGNPDPSLLPDLRTALAEVPPEPPLYACEQVLPALGEVLRSDFEADGIDASELAVTAGTLDGIERVLGAHLRQGDVVAVEDPGYSSVVELIKALGFRPHPVAIDLEGPIPDALEIAIGRGAEALVVTPRAQNPTGSAITSSRAKALRQVLLASPHVLVIEDDHAGPIAGVPYQTIISPESQRWAVARSAAKALGPDLRLSALAGDATTIARVRGHQAVGTGWVSHILQHAALAMMRAPGYAATIEHAAAVYAERRGAFVDRLVDGGVSVAAPSGLNVWVPVADEGAVIAAMEGRGYAVRSGSPFRLDAKPAIRVTISSHPPEVLTDAAAALVEVLEPQVARRRV